MTGEEKRGEPPAVPARAAGGEQTPLAARLAALREVTPPASLVAGVMRRLDPPPSPTFWSWLRRPRRLEVRLSPLGTVTMVVAVGGLLALAVEASTQSRLRASASHLVIAAPAPTTGETAGAATAAGATPTAPGARPRPGTVLVRFVLEAKGAQRVTLAGDFNGWSTEATPLDNAGGDGRFVATVALPPGDHQYMFVVDGAWVTDPSAAVRRPDGFGNENAVLRL